MQPPANIAAWRKAERARLLEARRAMPIAQSLAASETIMRALPAFIPSDGIIGCYWPFRREPDCLPFMRDVLKRRGKLALPVVIARGRPLVFRLWTERTKMEKGAWDILHPAKGASVCPRALVVPLLGFDDQGYRLGYGAGYYDMTLASLSPKPFTVGVGYEFSRLDTIFPQSHDVPLDVILTEACERVFRREELTPPPNLFRGRR